MKRIRCFGLSFVMTALIGVLLLVKMPEEVSMPLIANADKYVHAFLFMVLAWLIYHDARRAHFSSVLVYLTAAVWSIGWGGVLEVVQNYCLTYRSGSWWDFVADLIGIAMGIALARVWQK